MSCLRDPKIESVYPLYIDHSTCYVL